jgi:hypothetical protein
MEQDKRPEITPKVKQVFDEWRKQLEEDTSIVGMIERNEKVNVTIFAYRGRAVRKPYAERLPVLERD